MYEINFKFSVYADIPDWFIEISNNLPVPLTWSDYYAGSVVKYSEFYKFHNRSKDFPKYRVYTNNDLITERSWIWKSTSVCVEESIWLRIDNPQTIKLKVDTVDLFPCKTKFKIENFKVEGWDNEVVADEIESNELNVDLR